MSDTRKFVNATELFWPYIEIMETFEKYKLSDRQREKTMYVVDSALKEQRMFHEQLREIMEAYEWN